MDNKGITPELFEAMASFYSAMGKFKSETARFKCKKAIEYRNSILKTSREGDKIAKSKLGVK